MKKKLGVILGLCAILLGAWTLQAQAAEEEVVEALSKLADSIANGKTAKEVVAASEKIAKGPCESDVYLAMELMSKRKGKKGGVGIGKVGLVPANQDGIEAKFLNMKRRVTTDDVGKLQEALIRACHITASIAATSQHLCPVTKKKGKKDPAQWKQWAQDMYDSSVELAGALKKKDTKAAKEAAKKLNNSCVECHNVFRGA